MKVLVAGATGYVGAATVRSLERWCEVWTIRFDYIAPTPLWEVTNPDGAQVGMYSEEELPRKLGPIGFDILLNLSGDTSKGESFREISKLIDANVKFSAFLLRLCSDLGPMSYIGVSTFSIYDDSRVVAPQTFYALTKKMADDAISYFAGGGGCVSAISLELFDVYGPFHHPAKLIPQVLKSLRSKSVLTLHDDGRRKIRPIFLNDVVGALEGCVRFLATAAPGHHQFSAPGPRAMSIRDIFLGIASELDISEPHQFLQTGGASPVPSIDSSEPHYEAVPGWRPKTSFQEGIRQILLEEGSQ